MAFTAVQSQPSFTTVFPVRCGELTHFQTIISIALPVVVLFLILLECLIIHIYVWDVRHVMFLLLESDIDLVSVKSRGGLPSLDALTHTDAVGLRGYSRRYSSKTVSLRWECSGPFCWG